MGMHQSHDQPYSEFLHDSCLSDELLQQAVQHLLQCLLVLCLYKKGLVKPCLPDHIHTPLEHVVVRFLHQLVVSYDDDEQVPAL
jgi:hypothetical protein